MLGNDGAAIKEISLEPERNHMAPWKGAISVAALGFVRKWYYSCVRLLGYEDLRSAVVLYCPLLTKQYIIHPPTLVLLIDEQQDVTFWFIYLYQISSTCLGRCFRPSSGALDCIYNFWYSPPMLLPAGVMDEMEHRWTISEVVNTVKCSWWWAKTSSETCRADWVQINKPKIFNFFVINYELY